MVKDETKSALKLLSELPSHGKRRGRVVQDITDEMQASKLARHGRAIDDERSNDDISNLNAALRYEMYETCPQNGYLIRRFCVLQTESHASCEFTTQATQ